MPYIQANSVHAYNQNPNQEPLKQLIPEYKTSVQLSAMLLSQPLNT